MYVKAFFMACTSRLQVNDFKSMLCDGVRLVLWTGTSKQRAGSVETSAEGSIPSATLCGAVRLKLLERLLILINEALRSFYFIEPLMEASHKFRRFVGQTVHAGPSVHNTM